MTRPLAVAGGVALLAATAHVTISKTTGYNDAHAGLVLAIAAGAGIGAWALGVAWDEGRFVLTGLLALAMVSGELFGLSQTADRIAAERERSQAPARVQLEAHNRAVARVEAARTALAAIPTTSPQLVAAMAAKTAADRAVIDKSAERGCAANCRQLLEQQVDSAEREIAAAQDELRAQRSDANRELAAARDALDNAPPPKASGTPLADRLGVDPGMLDMIIAALGALGANGLAACLIAFGAHGRHHVPHLAQGAAAEAERPRAPATSVKLLPRPPSDLRRHAAEFSLACLRSAEGTDTPVKRLYRRYEAWCAKNDHAPLGPDELGRELHSLLQNYGVPVEPVDGHMVIRGVALAE